MEPDDAPQGQPALYRILTVVGIALMLTGIVGGAILGDLPETPTVATILPGIALLLFGIRGPRAGSQEG